MTTTEPITVEQYAKFDHIFVYCDPVATDPTQPDPVSPVDVTGWTARLQIRDRPGGTVAVDATTENGRITVGGVNGQIRVTLDGSVTAALTRDGVYDLLATPPSGSPERVAEGPAFVSLAVTVPPT